MYTSGARRLLFRADGDATIGLGHLMRLLALADILRGLASTVFLVREPTPTVARLVAEAGWSLTVLPAQPLAAEASWLTEHLLQARDTLVLDGYEFDLAYQERIRLSGCGLVYIDDLRAWPVVADVLINHSPGVVRADYQAEPDACLLLGPAFSLLRRPFLAAAAPPQPPGNFTSALVCFGGADPLGLTVRTLASLLTIPALQRLAVVIGGAFGDEAILQQLAAQHTAQRIEIYRNATASTLVDLMRMHALVIAPASTVLIEALVLGRPALTGYYVDNQRALANYVHTHQQAFSLGDFTVLNGPALTTALHQGLAALAMRPRQPYADHLQHGLLRTEVERLCHRQP